MRSLYRRDLMPPNAVLQSDANLLDLVGHPTHVQTYSMWPPDCCDKPGLAIIDFGQAPASADFNHWID